MHVDRLKCFQHSSTGNRRHCITLSVHLCVQHFGREKARRVGLFASAETCKNSVEVQQ